MKMTPTTFFLTLLALLIMGCGILVMLAQASIAPATGSNPTAYAAPTPGAITVAAPAPSFEATPTASVTAISPYATKPAAFPCTLFIEENEDETGVVAEYECVRFVNVEEALFSNGEQISYYSGEVSHADTLKVIDETGATHVVCLVLQVEGAQEQSCVTIGK